MRLGQRAQLHHDRPRLAGERGDQGRQGVAPAVHDRGRALHSGDCAMLLRPLPHPPHQAGDRGGLRPQADHAQVPEAAAAHPERRHGRHGPEESARQSPRRVQVGHGEPGAVHQQLGQRVRVQQPRGPARRQLPQGQRHRGVHRGPDRAAQQQPRRPLLLARRHPGEAAAPQGVERRQRRPQPLQHARRGRRPVTQPSPVPEYVFIYLFLITVFSPSRLMIASMYLIKIFRFLNHVRAVQFPRPACMSVCAASAGEGGQAGGALLACTSPGPGLGAGLGAGGDMDTQNSICVRNANKCRDRRPQGDGLRAASKLSSNSLFSVNVNMLHAECKHEARLTCRTICRDYCNNTAVHGFRYFFEENRSIQERTFWVFSVFFCFAVAFYLISKIWIKWETSPVIVTFAEQPTPIWEIPFPAVTICPATKTKRDVFDFTEAHRLLKDGKATAALKEKYQALSLICMIEATANDSMSDEYTSSPAENLRRLREFAPSVEEVVKECWWQHQRIANCSDVFQEVLTDEGLCFTFNALGPSEIFTNDTVEVQEEQGPSHRFRASGWNVRDGYVNDDPTVKSFYPRRSVFVGPFSGLRVILRSYDKDMDYICRGCEQGFRVFVHNPAGSSYSTAQQTALPLNTSMLLLAKPEVMKTSDGLLEFSPHRRRCYFPGERQLRYHKVYSLENCIFDCFRDLFYDKCGCSFLAPPRVGDKTVCSFMSKCVWQTHDELLNETATKIPFVGPVPAECQCLPSCATLHYDAQASIFDFPWLEEARARRQEPTVGVSYSQLNVYFDSLQFISSRRNELYGHTDFLANFGGLLGLFTGFSVISLVEIVYYVSLRLWCDVRRRRAERRRRDGS